MTSIKIICLGSLLCIILILFTGCGNLFELTTTSTGQVDRPEGWTDATHSNDVEPNYDIVFPHDKVNQIIITITPNDWAAMQADMTTLFGEQGANVPGQQPGGAIFPRNGGAVPGGVPMPGGADLSSENPMWAPATIEFNGLIWTNVGIRYKGNSSLMSSWRSGSSKMPFKLDFDQFEDEYPEINNQRFYGFKQLSLSNAFTDGTYMHDTLASDLLAEAGLPVAETAYYDLILDYGEGEINLGIYIMIEVVDDTVIERYFGDDSGNIYEGDGPGVSLATGTYSRIEDSFVKENNEDEADWNDIYELYNELHSIQRISSPEAWRDSLESIFDVNGFLKWLAISAIIQHWDTYGSMYHNFYLYHDPDTGLLTWISWDHNQVLAGDRTGVRNIKGIKTTVTLGREDVGQNWPLIRYLLDDPVYYERYVGYIEETINGVFNPEELTAKCNTLENILTPYISNGNLPAFESAVQALINRIDEQYQETVTFLAEESD